MNWWLLLLLLTLAGVAAKLLLLAVDAVKKWRKKENDAVEGQKKKENDAVERPSKQKIDAVNYHFSRYCNYQCGFCFHVNTNKFRLELDDAKRGLRLLREYGVRKVNFAGGEPLLVSYQKFTGELARFCKQELKFESVSIISNGSELSEAWLDKWGQFVDILGVSCDSFDPATNAKIGRRAQKPKGDEVDHVTKMRQIAGWCHKRGIMFKLNTVVNRYNVGEDMVEHVKALRPKRWKVFQVLKLEGENSGQDAKRDVTEFLIEKEEFEAFVARHQSVKEMVVERNEVMQTSYVMLDEKMRFLDCSKGGKTPTASILEAGGVEAALAQLGKGFDAQLFQQRNGEYEWTRPSGCVAAESSGGLEDIEDLVPAVVSRARARQNEAE